MTDVRFERLLYELLWLYLRADYNLSVQLFSIFVTCGFLREFNDFINEVEFYDINAVDDYYIGSKEQESPKMKDKSKTNIDINFSNYLQYINELSSMNEDLSIFSTNNYFNNCGYYISIIGNIYS